MASTAAGEAQMFVLFTSGRFSLCSSSWLPALRDPHPVAVTRAETPKVSEGDDGSVRLFWADAGRAVHRVRSFLADPHAIRECARALGAPMGDTRSQLEAETLARAERRFELTRPTHFEHEF